MRKTAKIIGGMGERIRFLANEHGGQDSFVEKIGVRKRTLGDYIAGKSEPKASTLIKMSQVTGFSVDWIVGESEIGGGAESYFDQAKAIVKQRTSEILEIPRFDVSASAGGGAFSLEEVPDRYVKISSEIMNQFVSNHSKLGVISITGDSMRPTLLDRDLVIIDFRYDRQDLIGGGIFVFTKSQDLFVKRMILMPDGKLIASSDNPEYPAFTFDTELETEEIIIHGKVIWVAGPPRPVKGQ